MMNDKEKIHLILFLIIGIILYLVLKEYKIIEGFTENIDSVALSAIASIYNDKVLTIDKLIVTDSIDVRNGKVKIDDNIVTTGSGTFGNAFIGKHPNFNGCAFGHKDYVGHSDVAKDSYFYSSTVGKNFIKSNGNFEFDETKVASFETNNIIATGNIYLHGGINAKHVGAREYVTSQNDFLAGSGAIRNNGSAPGGTKALLSDQSYKIWYTYGGKKFSVGKHQDANANTGMLGTDGYFSDNNERNTFMLTSI